MSTQGQAFDVSGRTVDILIDLVEVLRRAIVNLAADTRAFDSRPGRRTG